MYYRVGKIKVYMHMLDMHSFYRFFETQGWKTTCILHDLQIHVNWNKKLLLENHLFRRVYNVHLNFFNLLCIHVCKPIGYLQLTDWCTKLFLMNLVLYKHVEEVYTSYGHIMKKCVMTLSQFRTISLLNMEGKILLSVKANRTTKYMLPNNNVDIAVRTGGVPDASGCIEHTSIQHRLVDRLEKKKWS